VPIDGGAPVALSDAPHGRGGDWGADDSIIFAPDGNTGLSAISVSGGPPRLVTILDKSRGEVSHRAPQILPDGKSVLFTALTGPGNMPNTRVQSLVTGKTSLVEPDTWARYLPGNRLLYVSNRVAVTAPFDLERLAVTGPSTPLIEDIRPTLGLYGNIWPFAVSPLGSLVFVPGTQAAEQQRTLVWVDRHGVATPLGSPPRGYEHVRLSPDGQRLALTIREPSGTDIWMYELARDTFTRLTSDGTSAAPVWSPDGTRVAFSADAGREIAVRVANRGGPTERSFRATRPGQIPNAWFPESWSPDGRMLSVMQYGLMTMADIWSLSLDDSSTSGPIVERPGYQLGSRISPDGRWLAYLSEETGQWEVNVTSFPDGHGTRQVSSGGGTEVAWSRSGRELFYKSANGGALVAVPVDTRAGFVPAKPVRLFEAGSLSAFTGSGTFNVSPDGERFVMVRAHGEEAAANALNVVLGWTDELRRQANAGK
jgi:hypothetical protein